MGRLVRILVISTVGLFLPWQYLLSMTIMAIALVVLIAIIEPKARLSIHSRFPYAMFILVLPWFVKAIQMTITKT